MEKATADLKTEIRATGDFPPRLVIRACYTER